MIEGIYTFRDNGVIVAQQHNLITTVGKQAILNYLAKYSLSIADYVAVGSGRVAASVDDKTLGFEYARTPISLLTADYENTGITFKGILPTDVVGTVYEAGLWSGRYQGNSGSDLLLSFDQASEAWSAGTFTADSSKIGGDCLRVSATVSSSSSAESSGSAFDLSKYTSNDKFSLAYQCVDGNNASIKLRFKLDGSNYYETSIIGANTSGYHVVQVSKGDFVPTGSPDWSEINSIEVVSTAGSGGTSQVDFDGLRVEVDINPTDLLLVSRVVLDTPLVKTNIRPMEIEYRLGVSLA